MGTFLSFEDVSPLTPSLTREQADIYIEDVEAHARLEAPCIVSDDFAHHGAVRAILRQAVLRWARAGDGSVASEQTTIGPWGKSLTFDTRASGGGRLYPTEVQQLRALCRDEAVTTSRRRARTVFPR